MTRNGRIFTDRNCDHLPFPGNLRSLLCYVIIVCGLFLSSCTPKMFNGLKPADPSFQPEKVKLFSPGISESLVYKTNITYKDKEFSSLTYINAVGDSVFKI